MSDEFLSPIKKFLNSTSSTSSTPQKRDVDCESIEVDSIVGKNIDEIFLRQDSSIFQRISTKEDAETIQSVFHAIDTDEDGKLSQTELDYLIYETYDSENENDEEVITADDINKFINDADNIKRLVEEYNGVYTPEELLSKVDMILYDLGAYTYSISKDDLINPDSSFNQFLKKYSTNYVFNKGHNILSWNYDDETVKQDLYSLLSGYEDSYQQYKDGMQELNSINVFATIQGLDVSQSYLSKMSSKPSDEYMDPTGFFYDFSNAKASWGYKTEITGKEGVLADVKNYNCEYDCDEKGNEIQIISYTDNEGKEVKISTTFVGESEKIRNQTQIIDGIETKVEFDTQTGAYVVTYPDGSTKTSEEISLDRLNNLALNLTNGDENAAAFIQSLENASTYQDVYELLSAYCSNDKNTSNLLFACLMGEMYKDDGTMSGVENPYNKSNIGSANILSTLFTVRDDKFVVNDTLLSVFNNLGTNAAKEVGSGFEINSYYIDSDGELCTRTSFNSYSDVKMLGSSFVTKDSVKNYGVMFVDDNIQIIEYNTPFVLGEGQPIITNPDFYTGLGQPQATAYSLADFISLAENDEILTMLLEELKTNVGLSSEYLSQTIEFKDSSGNVNHKQNIQLVLDENNELALRVSYADSEGKEITSLIMSSDEYLQRKTLESIALKYTDKIGIATEELEQYQIIDLTNNLSSEMLLNLYRQDETDGWCGDVHNFIKEIINSDLARSEVHGDIITSFGNNKKLIEALNDVGSSEFNKIYQEIYGWNYDYDQQIETYNAIDSIGRDMQILLNNHQNGVEFDEEEYSKLEDKYIKEYSKVIGLSEDETKNILFEYSKDQNSAVERCKAIVTTSSLMLAVLAAPISGGTSLLGFTAIGMGSRMLVGATNSWSAGRNYSGSEALYDSIMGGTQGFAFGICNKATPYIAKGLQKAFEKTILGNTIFSQSNGRFVLNATSRGLNFIDDLYTNQHMVMIGNPQKYLAMDTRLFMTGYNMLQNTTVLTGLGGINGGIYGGMSTAGYFLAEASQGRTYSLPTVAKTINENIITGGEYGLGTGFGMSLFMNAPLVMSFMRNNKTRGLSLSTNPQYPSYINQQSNTGLMVTTESNSIVRSGQNAMLPVNAQSNTRMVPLLPQSNIVNMPLLPQGKVPLTLPAGASVPMLPAGIQSATGMLPTTGILQTGVSSATEAVVPSVTQNLDASDKAFRQALSRYHEGKVLVARGNDVTDVKEILSNWQSEYGIADENGKFSFAVQKLAEEGGAIDLYLRDAFPNMDATTAENAKKLLTDYLRENLEIYSFERMKSVLSEFDSSIQKLDNPVFYIPKDHKSYGVVAELYKTVNPNAEFVIGQEALLARLESSSSSSDIIILDDCIASGDSAIDVYNKIKDFPNCNGVSMYSFVVTKEGLSKIAESAPNLQVHYDGSPMLPVRETEFYNSLTLIGPKGKPIKIQQDFFVTLLEGAAKQSQYSSNGYAIMFEHMAPNNNNIFASNMILQLFSGPRVAVKNSSKRLGSIPKNLQYPPAWLIKTLGN